jgi:hypothetical protein
VIGAIITLVLPGAKRTRLLEIGGGKDSIQPIDTWKTQSPSVGKLIGDLRAQTVGH